MASRRKLRNIGWNETGDEGFFGKKACNGRLPIGRSDGKKAFIK